MCREEKLILFLWLLMTAAVSLYVSVGSYMSHRKYIHEVQQHTPCRAIDAAHHIIKQMNEFGDAPNHLLLQRILYHAQRDCLRKTGFPLFEDEFTLWQAGPVIPEVYRAHCVYGSRPITARRRARLTGHAQEFLDRYLYLEEEPSAREPVGDFYCDRPDWQKLWDNGEGKGTRLTLEWIREHPL